MAEYLEGRILVTRTRRMVTHLDPTFQWIARDPANYRVRPIPGRYPYVPSRAFSFLQHQLQRQSSLAVVESRTDKGSAFGEGQFIRDEAIEIEGDRQR